MVMMMAAAAAAMMTITHLQAIYANCLHILENHYLSKHCNTQPP